MTNAAGSASSQKIVAALTYCQCVQHAEEMAKKCATHVTIACGSQTVEVEQKELV